MLAIAQERDAALRERIALLPVVADEVETRFLQYARKRGPDRVGGNIVDSRLAGSARRARVGKGGTAGIEYRNRSNQGGAQRSQEHS